MKKILLGIALLPVLVTGAAAQGTLSGDLQTNVNFFQRDSAIKASGNPLYDNYLSGGEAWLSLRYNYKTFTATVRLDGFQNSNLYNPSQAFTAYGIGAFSISKQVGDLNITGGYIYDQIGSGILFRSYEDRGLLIDNALVGLRLQYKLNDHLMLKAMTGQQKNESQFNDGANNRYAPVIKTLNVEGDYSIGNTIHLSPGAGALNRTLDANSRNTVVSTAQSEEAQGQIKETSMYIPYNMYAFTAYNTLTAGNFNWYAEGAYKTKEAIVGLDNLLHATDGSVLYSTLGYAQKGIALNLTGKRTENFSMRTSPNQTLLNGELNWQPIVARLRPERLISRYTPASQDLSETALGADLLLAPSEPLTITLNYTHINELDGTKLYREIFGEAEYRGLKKWVFSGGVQILQYNQQLYQTKPNAPLFKAVTGFSEVTYRIDKKKSVRVEAEYMATKQDYGSWMYALVEFNVAPQWSFSLSDMYNNKPNLEVVSDGVSHHYYNAFLSYTKGPHRFTAAYVKQVEGINCTGGVCRYEPAFSGIRLSITSSF